MRLVVVLLLLAWTANSVDAGSTRPTFVDLAVVEFATDPPRPLAGEPYRLSAIVENRGTEALTRSIVVTFARDDVVFDEVRLAASHAAPLLPGDRVTVSSIDVVSGPGWSTASATIDTRGAVLETDELNNVEWTKVGVALEMLRLTNPKPGERYETSAAFTLNTTWDEPFAMLDCAHAGSIVIEGLRSGAFARTCVDGALVGTDTYALLPGSYVAAFSTSGADEVAVFAVPQPFPEPQPPH